MADSNNTANYMSTQFNPTLTSETLQSQLLTCKCLTHNQEYPQNGHCVYCGSPAQQTTWYPMPMNPYDVIITCTNNQPLSY